ncbi:MAG TPA: DsbA family protein, partial [Azonexus sp.]|nr:DsbA family protein [Azonexus sp.]
MVLHYIYDPFCGWCYAAAPLVRAARQVLAVQAHGGGMMAGSRRQTVSPQLRDYVMPHDRRIAELTGQPFGDAYFNGLLLDQGAVLDSAPPIAAMLAAERLGGRGLDLLSRLQTAHYVEGRRIAEIPVLIELAGTIGLEPAAFGAALEATQGEATLAHIEESRRRLAEVGGSGFPTFVLEKDGSRGMLDISAYLGRPEAWQAFLE